MSLQCGRIIKGDPKASKKPPTSQKWVMHNKEGGGAVIPCTWKLSVRDSDDADSVKKLLQDTIECMKYTELHIERLEVNEL